MGAASYYEALSEQGLVYGPSFQGLVQVWPGSGEALGEVQRPNSLATDAQTNATFRGNSFQLDGNDHAYNPSLPWTPGQPVPVNSPLRNSPS